MRIGSPSSLTSYNLRTILYVHLKAPFLDVKLASIRDHPEAQYVFITFASPAHATQAIADLMTCDLHVIIDATIACKPPSSHTSIYDAVTIYPPATGKPWQMPLYCIVKGCSHGPGLDLAPSFITSTMTYYVS